MSYTFTEHKTDGVTTTFPFSFAGKDKAYLRSSDVVVFLRVSGKWTEVTNWSLSGTNQITFTSPPAASPDINLRIRRIVPKINPYAEFDRGVTLDMRSLNYSFIQNLEVVQELMDGFFPEGFFYKEDLNMGFNKIVNLKAGTEPFDAVNYTQLYTVDQKHTLWNQQQDVQIEGLKSSLQSGTAHRTIPWFTTAAEGQTVVNVPYSFKSALVYRNGVLMYELNNAVKIENNTIIFSEPLFAGDEILVLVGSRTASPEDGEAEIVIEVTEGQTVVPIGSPFSGISVLLDGLGQPSSAYAVEGQSLRFSEPLPECTLIANITISAGGSE